MTTVRVTDTLRPTPTSPGRRTNTALWALQVLLALFFVMAAVPKLLGATAAVESFDDIGLGQWFRYLVGAVELAGAVGLVTRRWTGLAALGLAGVMVGATITNLFVLDEGSTAIMTVALCGLFCGIAWGRRSTIPLPEGRTGR